MIKTLFIFHGTEGYPEENWFPWLKQKVEDNSDYNVIVPQFPSPPKVAASVDEWFSVLKEYENEINKNTVLVGHSLGGLFALRVLEKLKKKVKATFLISAPIGVRPILNYERDETFSGFGFDWNSIKGNCSNFVVFHSDDDPYVSLGNGEKIASELGTELTFIPNAGHFNEKAGYTEFEELWKKLKPFVV